MTASLSSDPAQHLNQSTYQSTYQSTSPAPHDYTKQRIIVQAIEDDKARRAELKAGLLASPARIAPKFFYDPQGCALFDAICKLDEYYPTRTEQKIFDRYRAAIARHLPQSAQWIDLGCGDCAKSRPWLAAVAARRFVGVDIAQQWLRAALARLSAELPAIECLGVVADFNAPLALQQVIAQMPDAAPVFFYPGSSIGNFPAPEALRLLTSIHDHLGEDGRLLIGVDLVKDIKIMQAAYDDALGVTAAFNRNVLRVANRLLRADFVPADFDHLAFFNADESRIEMYLQARQAQTVHIGDTPRTFAAGETILTEWSCKYTHDSFGALLNQAGFSEHHFWTDERQGFGVFVAAP